MGVSGFNCPLNQSNDYNNLEKDKKSEVVKLH